MSCCQIGGDEQTFLSATKGMCRECREIVDARYVARGERVFLERHCPSHGKQTALVARRLSSYLEMMRTPPGGQPPRRVLTERQGGCPTSCGPCSFHGQNCHLPVFSITNACDLRCPICFTYNRTDQTFFMSEEAFVEQIDFVIDAAGPVDLVNITGGEPTLHPELPRLLRHARRPEIGRITVNTNGLNLARNPGLARELADLGVYLILSFDTFNPRTSQAIHGRDIVEAKLSALETAERYGIPTTLLMVLIKSVNEADLAPVVELALSRDIVRSLTIQTMTYTGQGGGEFLPRAHLPVDEVEELIEAATSGRIPRAAFMPLPSAHPLCYGVAYLMSHGGATHCLTELLDKSTIGQYLQEGYLLRPSDELEIELKQAIDRLWSEGGDPEVLSTLKSMMTDLFPAQPITVAERQRRAEKQLKTIYVHAHMDEDTWELGRAVRCPDQVPVDGKQLIGACNYNLFYRMRDERFWVTR